MYLKSNEENNQLGFTDLIALKHDDGLSYYDRDVDSKKFLKQRKILRIKGILKN